MVEPLRDALHKSGHSTNSSARLLVNHSLRLGGGWHGGWGWYPWGCGSGFDHGSRWGAGVASPSPRRPTNRQTVTSASANSQKAAYARAPQTVAGPPCMRMLTPIASAASCLEAPAARAPGRVRRCNRRAAPPPRLPSRLALCASCLTRWTPLPRGPFAEAAIDIGNHRAQCPPLRAEFSQSVAKTVVVAHTANQSTPVRAHFTSIMDCSWRGPGAGAGCNRTAGVAR
jgi:hypothetical protein